MIHIVKAGRRGGKYLGSGVEDSVISKEGVVKIYL